MSKKMNEKAGGKKKIPPRAAAAERKAAEASEAKEEAGKIAAVPVETVKEEVPKEEPKKAVKQAAPKGQAKKAVKKAAPKAEAGETVKAEVPVAEATETVISAEAPAAEAVETVKEEPPVEINATPRRSVAFIGSECYPFVKTGGLGDVMYALPKALVKQNCDVKVILPRYKCIPWEYQEKMVYRGAFEFYFNFL